MGPISEADCTPKNNGKKSGKYMSYVSSFMRYEFSVLITFFSLFLSVQSAPEVGPTYETPYI